MPLCLWSLFSLYLRTPRRRLHFAGAERCSRVSQLILDPRCGRVRTAEHPPRGPSYLLERRHAFAEIVERGSFVSVYQLARTLIELGSYDQVKSLVLPLLRQFKPTSKSGQSFRLVYAKALYRPAGASRAEVSEAVAIFDDVLCKLRRVLGPSHPETLATLAELDRARMTLEDYLKFKS